MLRYQSVSVVLCLFAASALSSCSRSGGSAAPGRKGGGAGVVPVVAGKVQQRDTPIYLDGIGTVQAFNTVTIHTQVNGVLQKVAFEEGQDVKTGDVLALIDARSYQAQYDGAKAKKDQDEAQLGSAKLTFDRDYSLLQKGLMDQQTVDQNRASRDQMTAAVQADQAALEQQGVLLGYCTIKSPINGRTGVRLVDQGNVVQTSDPTGLVVVTQMKPISVAFSLPQQDWKKIQQLVANGNHLPVVATGDGAAPLDQGFLSVVDNQIDVTTGTLKLKATFPNSQLALWPGQFVNVRLLLQTRKAGLVVPASVIQRGPQGPYAFVIKEDSTVEARPVEVAQIDSGFALIDKGLEVGEQVVVDGQYQLQTGSKVSTAPRQKAKAVQPAS